MNERGMLCNRPRILDSANGQHVQVHRNPEPCNVMGSTSNYRQLDQVLPPSGSVNSFDLHHVPGHHGSRQTFNGTAQYNQPNYPAPNHFGSGARMLPMPNNHGFEQRLPSLSNYGANVVPFNEHGRSTYTAGVRDLSKQRRHTIGFPSNAHHFGPSAGPSTSSGAPITCCHFDSQSPSIRPLGPWSTSDVVGVHTDSGMVHTSRGQSIQPPCFTCLDQHSISDARILPGNSERFSNNHSATFLRTPPVAQQHHILHSSQNTQGVSGHGSACDPSFLAAPSRVPPNDSRQHNFPPIPQENIVPANQLMRNRIHRSQRRNSAPVVASRSHVSQEIPEAVNRLTSNRIHLSRGRNQVSHVSSRHHGPQGGFVPANRPSSNRIYQSQRLNHAPLRLACITFQLDVAILEEYSIENYNFNVHHSDAGLDFETMPYEDSLILSEQIGTISAGLTEEDIICHLKTKRFSATKTTVNQEESPCTDEANDSCIICQDEYEDNDKLGTLECGHEYHLDCLKKWLLLKNLCPLCKSPALAVPHKDF